MWVHLKNGRSFYFKDGDHMQTGEEELGDEMWVCDGEGNLLATFKTDAIACYFDDSVDVTTFGPTDKLEVPE